MEIHPCSCLLYTSAEPYSRKPVRRLPICTKCRLRLTGCLLYTSREEVTLHVGAGTFKPVKSLEIEGHQMHTEYIVEMCIRDSNMGVVMQQHQQYAQAIGCYEHALRCNPQDNACLLYTSGAMMMAPVRLMSICRCW